MSERPMIGVVGLGAMGLGIVQLFAQAGYPVVATDAHPPTRQSAGLCLADALNARVAAGKLSEAARDATLVRVNVVDDLAGFAPAQLIVEAIIERLDAKQALFAELEKLVSTQCVLATNTSSLSVAAIFQQLQTKNRALGLHFFNPAPVMKLVELVLPPGVDADADALARQLTEAAGKTVIACADRPGFIVNRCARPFYGEALAMVEEGRAPSEIDAAMKQAGYRLGPLSLIDLIGADINLGATESLSAAMGNHPRYHVFDALQSQVASNRLGRKTGQGFLFPQEPGAAPADAADIVLRIEATLANEAASLMGEGGPSAADIDTAMKLGLNFPRGPFESCHRHGLAVVLAKLAELEKAAPRHLKGRYVAAQALEAMK